MRKIENDIEKTKRESRQKKIVMTIMLGLLLLSSVGFAFSLNLENNPAEQIPTTSEGNTGFLKYSYEEVKNISVQEGIEISRFQNQLVYIAGDNEETKSELELGLSGYSGRIQRACYGECSEDLPEKSCKDNLIVIQKSEIQEVILQENCILINGDSKAVDAFIYSLSGIK